MSEVKIKDFDDLLQTIGTGPWNFLYYIGMSIGKSKLLVFSIRTYVFIIKIITNS